MDFIDRIRELGSLIPSRVQDTKTEEATKIAFVQPFIRALGYDMNDPREATPEFTADIGEKRGEKVDYAIRQDGRPVILIECKWSGTDLDRIDASQLERYFMVTEARLGVLTNGIIYRFFSDLEKPNIMDKKPFLELDLLDVKEPLVEEVKKFTKSAFDLQNILTTASELKYTREIVRLLSEEWNEPSDEFVRFFARDKHVYSGLMTKAALEQFGPITKRALHQFVSDRFSDRLKSVLQVEGPSSAEGSRGEPREPQTEGDREQPKDRGVVTTEEELEGYYIVKSILREATDVSRIAMRDRKSYCGIFLDDNALKGICRLWFNTSQKYLGLFDDQKHEEKVPIDDLNDIYRYADQLKETVGVLDSMYEIGSASPIKSSG